VNNLREPANTELLRRARDGCDLSKGQLLERYRKYLTMLARIQLRRSLRGKAGASDMVQETYLFAHKAFDQFRGSTEHELVGWLRAILASRLVRLARAHQQQRRNVDLERRLSDEPNRSSAALDSALIQFGGSPTEIAVEREHALLIVGAIEDLPANYRSVILLRQIEGLPYSDVAAAMGRSVDSVKKLWVRALSRLQRSIEAKLKSS
jgi:RNA polymerase sigma-70 factor (ECF subfamily)